MDLSHRASEEAYKGHPQGANCGPDTQQAAPSLAGGVAFGPSESMSAETDTLVLALDIGGTKLATAVVDEKGHILASGRAPTIGARDAEELYATLRELCRQVLAEAGRPVRAVGVGCGGPMEYPQGKVSPLNIPVWRDFPLRDRLAADFREPCIVDNDAKAMALGEQWQGAGRGARNVMGMVVSTGVGGGLIVDGRLLHGQHGNAGHVGHVIVWPDGPLCGCGARGCVEGIASGSGMVRRIRTALAQGVATSLTRESTAADVAAAARDGDGLAVKLFRDAGTAVGRGVASSAALLDLQRVVIGGSIALKAWDLLGPPLTAEVAASARLDFTRNLQVVQAGLGDAAGLIGAAALALQLLGGSTD